MSHYQFAHTESSDWIMPLRPPALCCVRGFGSAVMSTPLVAALRESCGYLRDDGYHQTALLMATAADEIERLVQRADAPEPDHQAHANSRRPSGHFTPTMKPGVRHGTWKDLGPQLRRK